MRPQLIRVGEEPAGGGTGSRSAAELHTQNAAGLPVNRDNRGPGRGPRHERRATSMTYSPRTTSTRVTLHPPGAAITPAPLASAPSVTSCHSRQCVPRDAAVRVEGRSSITDLWPVAEQALPEPFVPGSGDRLPAELRLVLARYVGIACGLFAGALACAAAAVFLVFFVVDPDGDWNLPWSLFALQGCIGGAVAGATPVEALIRYSRLLRQPSDPHKATVTASKRGGRTLVLDTTPGGYQPLSEVRLAWWTKADMLMPGERVTVYGRPGGKNPLLVSSAQRRRAFLGTETGRSTLPAGPLDEKVSGATLVDWAAWAASTTFSSTALKSGYDEQEVDAFRSAVRDVPRGRGLLGKHTPGEIR
jgi:hypothetical protein